jgi:hypothetical protein
MVKQILLLKSAFSIIDQMFHKEIENAQIMKSRKYWDIIFHYEPLDDPLSLNPFVNSLMDPFNHMNINSSDSDSDCGSHHGHRRHKRGLNERYSETVN